jgi:hypothetical protein
VDVDLKNGREVLSQHFSNKTHQVLFHLEDVVNNLQQLYDDTEYELIRNTNILNQECIDTLNETLKHNLITSGDYLRKCYGQTVVRLEKAVFEKYSYVEQVQNTTNKYLYEFISRLSNKNIYRSDTLDKVISELTNYKQVQQDVVDNGVKVILPAQLLTFEQELTAINAELKVCFGDGKKQFDKMAEQVKTNLAAC